VFLEVETFHLWGSINAPTFFDSTDLQSTLIEEASTDGDSDGKAFIKWFGTAVSAAYRAKARFRARQASQMLVEGVHPGVQRKRLPLSAKQLQAELALDAVDLQAGSKDEFGLEGAATLAFEKQEAEALGKEGSIADEAAIVFEPGDLADEDEDILSDWRRIDTVQ
jgi:hypothetical protein